MICCFGQPARLPPRRYPATVVDGTAARKTILRRIYAFGMVFGLASGSCAPATLPDGAGPRAARSHVDDAAEPRRPSVGVALLRDDQSRLPLDPRRIASMVVITSGSARGDMPGRHLAAELRDIFGDVRYHALDGMFGRKQAERALAEAAAADAVVFALLPGGHGDSRDAESLRRLYAALHSRSARLVTIGFGDAAVTAAGLRASALFVAGSAEPAAQRAAARALAGLRAVNGRTAITLPGHPAGSGLVRAPLSFALVPAPPESVGMSPAVLEQVDSIIEEALLAGAAPGAAIAVGRHGRLVKLRGYGTLDSRPGLGLASDSTIYDLASLTKVVATTTLAMMLVDEGLLDLDAPVSEYLPEWRADGARSAVTVRHLLSHSSGLPPYGPLYAELRGREAYARRIGGLALEYAPGSETVYSDFGPILLAFIVERLTGYTLDELFQERVAGPLGLRETGFNPRGWQAGGTSWLASGDDGSESASDNGDLLHRVAPTEFDAGFRGRHIHGDVHDENAYALGGVAGHAGLFGSARDLARFAQMLLDGGFFGGRRYVRAATVREFTRRQGKESSRALGWDTPAGISSAGDFFSAASFGHTGFTGTSIWIDPERELFLVLLTNRVNPSRDNQRHVPLRRAVADAVQRAIIDSPVAPRVP